MKSESNVCIDIIKLFKTPRNKKHPLYYHINCIISAYQYSIKDALNLDEIKPLIDILSRNAIYVYYPGTSKMKNKNKIRCIEGWDDNDYS